MTDDLPAEGRLIAIDLGDKRIGLAMSDPTQALAQPLDTLVRRAGKRFPLKQLRVHLEHHTPVGIVLGLPLESDGSEGGRALEARDVGNLIREKSGLPVTLYDQSA